MKKKNLITILLFVAVIIASLIMRVVPHPANFIPIGALALLSGVYIKSKWGVLIPVVVMMSSDLIIGMHNLVLFTWGGFLLFGILGWWIKRHKNIFTIIGGTIAGSVIFYIVTNFAVWAFTPLYSKTSAGLINSYFMAIPFFRNAALGDLFYTAIFFGAFELVYLLVFNKAKKEIVKSEFLLK